MECLVVYPNFTENRPEPFGYKSWHWSQSPTPQILHPGNEMYNSRYTKTKYKQSKDKSPSFFFLKKLLSLSYIYKLTPELKMSQYDLITYAARYKSPVQSLPLVSHSQTGWPLRLRASRVDRTLWLDLPAGLSASLHSQICHALQLYPLPQCLKTSSSPPAACTFS